MMRDYNSENEGHKTKPDCDWEWFLLSCSERQTERSNPSLRAGLGGRKWKRRTLHHMTTLPTTSERTNERTKREESGFTWFWVRKGSSIPTQNKTSFITDFRKRLLCFKNQGTLWTSVTAIQSWKEFLLLFFASLWRDKETPSTLAFIFAFCFSNYKFHFANGPTDESPFANRSLSTSCCCI